jgi:hypothetical protein
MTDRLLGLEQGFSCKPVVLKALPDVVGPGLVFGVRYAGMLGGD